MSVPRVWRKTKEHYNLVGIQCEDCRALLFPCRAVCSECGSTNLSDYKFQGRGKIVTYTIIRTSQQDTDSEPKEIPMRNTPYVMAIIELDEGPRITAEIVDLEISELKIGQQVELVFRKLIENGVRGIIQYGYKFSIV